jgi:serine/threonine protein kinase
MVDSQRRDSISESLVNLPNGSIERHVSINRCSFKVPERFSCLKAVGKGSYGVVVQAQDALRNKQVAIKKISPVTSHSVDAKHVLREVRLMRHLGVHENIVTLQDLLYREQNDELYIVMELLDSDLHRIIQSSQTLKDEHHRIFMLQLLRGVQFLHENGVIHRDLKPGNLLVTRNCDLRITDFGKSSHPLHTNYLH